MNNAALTLQLDALHERHTGLTAALAGTFFEAASVCFAKHHNSPVTLEIVRDGGTSNRTAAFATPDQRMNNAWSNHIDATEFGAYGVSLAAIEAEQGLVAVKRAETLTGADWYVAPAGSTAEDLEKCLRLEVSGTDAGGRAAVESRLREKVEQTRRGKSNLPALAAVVGFKERAVVIEAVSETT